MGRREKRKRDLNERETQDGGKLGKENVYEEEQGSKKERGETKGVSI